MRDRDGEGKKLKANDITLTRMLAKKKRTTCLEMTIE